ncbi:hypothetical protein VFPPC_16461 [Pochonia chlamydosporia 170]|uniref:PSI domain-containing protein n=1 Tax=Pochonia chlamydosporia 170 TaxID=1380566 RepID=A0A179FDA7_METCM|nr:hypothetical protein VFPPC_16461 [Pochonia chlamydosporia 170]OAQ63338.1 hypothetical protein VFPPC_16461 [Pochonia chlamydosporia 170]
MASSLQASDIDAFRSNFTAAESNHDHLLRCWAQQTCGGCLDTTECSWCPYTWSCIPNSYRVPLLAPIYNERICPHPAERWEVRTHPFGCNVSTTTSLTAIVSVVATLVLALIVLTAVILIRRLRRSSKQFPNWRRYFTIRRRTDNSSQERDPLLPAQGRGQEEGA